MSMVMLAGYVHMYMLNVMLCYVMAGITRLTINIFEAVIDKSEGMDDTISPEKTD